MSTSIGTAAPTTSTAASSVTSAAQAANLASESTFLQLLVAQLQNQDPSDPTDGTAFVTELAQFTTLSEDTESATDLDTIVAALPSLEPAASVAAAASGTPAASNGTTSAPTNNPVNQ
jgi:flagellar basal-body rod modification protein FlgD